MAQRGMLSPKPKKKDKPKSQSVVEDVKDEPRQTNTPQRKINQNPVPKPSKPKEEPKSQPIQGPSSTPTVKAPPSAVSANRHDVFGSYSRKDADLVQTVVNELQSMGYKVWIDKDGIESGDPFKAVIVKAIKNSAVFLFFSSKNANESPWTVKEVNAAVALRKNIIPVKLDYSDYDDSVFLDLAGVDFVDLTDESKHSYAIKKLVKSLKKNIPNPINGVK